MNKREGSMKYVNTFTLVSLLSAIALLPSCSSDGMHTMTSPMVSPQPSDHMHGHANALLNNPLIQQVSSDLNVNSQQALSGTGALLAMAAQTLNPAENKELMQAFPDMSALTSMLPTGGADSPLALDNTFNMLGLSSDMIPDFASVLLNYFQSNGASTDLIRSLATAWAS